MLRSRKKGCTSAASAKRRQTFTGGWFIASTSRPARSAGSARSRKGRPTVLITSRTPMPQKLRLLNGERVYAYFGNAGLFCFDMNGKLLWSKNLGTFPTRFGWGTAASPVLYKD